MRRIVYLGGLEARGRVDLRTSGVSTIEFRASIVIGSGSASFELLRALVERPPVMVTPRWVGIRTQPIAIENVLACLLAALDHEPGGGEVFGIGGADVCRTTSRLLGRLDHRRDRRAIKGGLGA